MSKEKETIINGIDVSECEQIFVQKNCALLDQEYCEDNPDCYFKQLKRLQEDNEKIKKQYNCYACGNCKGKEDYINLEKHHKGLRKQFDELVKRNNTLSLRIEELEKENKKLKKRQITKNGFICDCEQNAKYKQALKEIRKLINETCWDYTDISIIPVKEKMLEVINEVLK